MAVLPLIILLGFIIRIHGCSLAGSHGICKCVFYNAEDSDCIEGSKGNQDRIKSSRESHLLDWRGIIC